MPRGDSLRRKPGRKDRAADSESNIGGGGGGKGNSILQVFSNDAA